MMIRLLVRDDGRNSSTRSHSGAAVLARRRAGRTRRAKEAHYSNRDNDHSVSRTGPLQYTQPARDESHTRLDDSASRVCRQDPPVAATHCTSSQERGTMPTCLIGYCSRKAKWQSG